MNRCSLPFLREAGSSITADAFQRMIRCWEKTLKPLLFSVRMSVRVSPCFTPCQRKALDAASAKSRNGRMIMFKCGIMHSMEISERVVKLALVMSDAWNSSAGRMFLKSSIEKEA
jgi:hypothetical protein